ncbi:Acetyltransferase YpeA [Posidoniimonas polymericola]|uniref:Acetyltransferase YpeA n=1 Tax=Posidoniimonas polymericola TaxID=2528002 RepID=A0A5C5YQU1_9BACT|nr:GNAT family N-acetyltransferase [Posidoniimonas polymericola]TWT77322.1 Acetyltransferase YpeA [Posidoniimonas polymericola]
MPAASETFRVRPMTIDDYPAVYALWVSTPGVGVDETDERDPTARFLERNPGLSLVAADSDQQIVAAVLCGHDGRRGYLSHLAVDERARGVGLGRRLVAECLAALAGQGVGKCNVRIFAENEAAARFWERMGYARRADLAVWQRTTSS